LAAPRNLWPIPLPIGLVMPKGDRFAAVFAQPKRLLHHGDNPRSEFGSPHPLPVDDKAPRRLQPHRAFTKANWPFTLVEGEPDRRILAGKYQRPETASSTRAAKWAGGTGARASGLRRKSTSRITRGLVPLCHTSCSMVSSKTRTPPSVHSRVSEPTRMLQPEGTTSPR
jgi:hypothetical protein